MLWFEIILSSAVILCGLLSLIGLMNKSVANYKIIKIARSYLGVLLLVFVVRSFIFQPFKVVSGSLEPTVLIGDFIAVNQSEYGIRLPVIHKKIFNINSPKLGDIALFHYPLDPNIIFVKRVIGTPGDHIVYKDKQLTINGKLMTQTPDGIGFDEEVGQVSQLMSQRIENLNGIKHKIFVDENRIDKEVDVIVPKNQYFMMGDNRDDSGDSRYWGFVDDNLLIGKAYRVLASWDTKKFWFRMPRFGAKFTL